MAGQYSHYTNGGTTDCVSTMSWSTTVILGGNVQFTLRETRSAIADLGFRCWENDSVAVKKTRLTRLMLQGFDAHGNRPSSGPLEVYILGAVSGQPPARSSTFIGPHLSQPTFFHALPRIMPSCATDAAPSYMRSPLSRNRRAAASSSDPSGSQSLFKSPNGRQTMCRVVQGLSVLPLRDISISNSCTCARLRASGDDVIVKRRRRLQHRLAASPWLHVNAMPRDKHTVAADVRSRMCI